MSMNPFEEFIKGQRSLEQEAMEEASNELAEILHSTFRALIRKGFRREEAFELTKATLLSRAGNANPGD